jgi:hypothetical protein
MPQLAIYDPGELWQYVEHLFRVRHFSNMTTIKQQCTRFWRQFVVGSSSSALAISVVKGAVSVVKGVTSYNDLSKHHDLIIYVVLATTTGLLSEQQKYMPLRKIQLHLPGPDSSVTPVSVTVDDLPIKIDVRT